MDELYWKGQSSKSQWKRTHRTKAIAQKEFKPNIRVVCDSGGVKTKVIIHFKTYISSWNQKDGKPLCSSFCLTMEESPEIQPNETRCASFILVKELTCIRGWEENTREVKMISRNIKEPSFQSFCPWHSLKCLTVLPVFFPRLHSVCKWGEIYRGQLFSDSPLVLNDTAPYTVPNCFRVYLIFLVKV